MSRGTTALVLGLFVLSAVVVLVMAIFVSLTGAASGGHQSGVARGFGTLLFQNLLHAMDAGTVAGDAGRSALFIASMMFVTVAGIFVVSALIGVISAGLDTKMSELRKGRSRVIEHGHTVVLGWSQEIFTVLSELIEANSNTKRALIVVLANRDKVEMEDEIRSRLGGTGRTRIVCRSGSPTDLDDIDIANIQASKSVIVLSPEVDDPDPDVLKTLLAVVKSPARRAEPYHVVAEIRDPENIELARMIGGDEVELIRVDDLISRITAQTCRQSGLSVVYTELLDFAGDEIYFADASALVGTTFGDALSRFDSSAVIGIHNGGPRLNPPMETVIASGDKLIVIAEDDDTTRASGSGVADEAAIVAVSAGVDAPERTLVLGWNRRAGAVITELDGYVTEGSEVVVLSPPEMTVDEPGGLVRTKVLQRTGDPTDRATLDSLELGTFAHLIVLSDTEADDIQRADARTLVTLLHLRDIASRSGAKFSITSEMLDLRNRALAEVAKADDFIVSERLVSLLMAQISENKGLGAVFADLFDSAGSEIYLRPASRYVATGREIDFYTVLESARRRGEIAIGYRIASRSDSADDGYGVVVNPKKSSRLTFTDRDKVIVLAED